MTEAGVDASGQRSTNRLVFKNTLLLVGAKVLATPIAVVSNAIIARYLGAADYSFIYLATTYTTFAMLFVIFGQSGALPALVAVSRAAAGRYLGSALSWRLASGLLVYGVLALGCWAFGYGLDFQKALALVFLAALTMSMAGACLETIRAFDRTDVDALTNVGVPILTAAITIPVVIWGGRLLSVLAITVVVAAMAVGFVSRFLRPVGIGALSVSRPTLRTLLLKGYPFLFFSAAMTLQPTVDAGFLSKLSTPEVVGWHAAAYKLIGLVVFPASALITALYPVLCRLFAEDRVSYASTTRSTLQTSVLLMVPVAFGCGLFPEFGVMVYGESEFGAIADNLRVFAIYVFFVYVSMPLGSAVLAADRARAWSLVQAICVVISCILDPILVPYFQQRSGNGGLGIGWASVASEVFMVTLGLVLLPRGVLAWGMLKPLGSALVGGGAMVAIAWGLRQFSPFLVAPLAVLGYAVALYATGGLGREQVAFLKSVASRKVKKQGADRAQD